MPIVRPTSHHNPFGMVMPSRSWEAGSDEEYGFGYQGSLKNSELTAGVYSTYYRELDTRLGRWWSMDPEYQNTPWESAYTSMSNNPIILNDLLGNSPEKRLERKINRFNKKLDKAGILDVSQRLLLTSMMISNSSMYKKGKLEEFSSFHYTQEEQRNSEESETTGGEFGSAELSNLPNLNINTLFDGGTAVPTNPANLTSDVAPVAAWLINNPTIQIDLIGVTNSRLFLSIGNMSLGRARATAIANELITQNVNPAQIGRIRGAPSGFRLLQRVGGDFEGFNRRVVVQLPSANQIVRRTRQALSKEDRRYYRKMSNLPIYQFEIKNADPSKSFAP